MALLYILICIVLLMFALLAVPVEIEYAYDSKTRPRSTGRIVWMFGLVRFRPRGKKEKEQLAERKRKVAPERPGPRRSAKARKKRSRVFLATVRSEGFIRRIFKLLRAVLAATGIKQLRARLLIGFDDPADTGIVFSRLMPGLSFLYAMPRVDFVAVPVFDRSAVETDMHVKLRMVPINYLNALVVFVFSKETFRAAGAAYRAYRQ